MEIGLVGEGITDQIVLENILYGFFDDDLGINPLEPLRDQTDQNLMVESGNWTKVLDYCKSDAISKALQFNDYVIIQIDTDVRSDYGIPVNDPEGKAWEVDALMATVKEYLISLMEPAFYEEAKNRILFAIAVHQMECWLLPLWEPNSKKQRATNNCFKKLSDLTKKDKKKLGFYLDAKKPDYYRRLSKDYEKPKLLRKHYAKNPSLEIFIESLKETFLDIQ